MRTRFAPSPTGYLHIGGLRTALYQYLLARHNDGEFLLRIEDTDRERYVEGGVENFLHSLYWTGVIPDEGVILENGQISEKGNNGPYFQSKRLDIYHEHANKLIGQGDAYYCFCTAERLTELRKDQEARKKPTGYDQFCLKNVSLEDAKKRISAGEKHVVRLKMPKTGQTEFNDLIRGKVIFKNDLVDDQVLLKSDGYPTYHLAAVIDDHLMGITHVVRGEEWVSSTPKHIQLYKCFGWNPPEFAHLSLLLNPDKSKLSKRQGDVAVSDYENKGYLPEALVNFIAFLGWNPGDDREIFSLDELVKEFNIEKINKTGAVFNLEKLNWYNKEYIKKLSASQLVKKAMPFFERDEFYKNKKLPNNWMERVLGLERERITTLNEFPAALKFVFEIPDYEGGILVWKKSTKENSKNVLVELRSFLNSIDESKWNKPQLEKLVFEWIDEKGYGKGDVLWPMRVALSGQQNSPGPCEIAEVLGKSETLNRIELAISKL